MMEKGSESIRERLLARLPQVEKREAYREQTVALVAKHERALFWEKVAAITIIGLSVGVLVWVTSGWGLRLDTNGTVRLAAGAALFFFCGTIYGLGYRMSRDKLDLLKELKQVQLQILELQSSVAKCTQGGRPSRELI